jgi:hypothetical protein
VSEPVSEPTDAVTAVVEAFLDSLGKLVHGLTRERTWERYVAARALPFRGVPAIPGYLQYRVVGVEPCPPMPEPGCRRVMVALMLVPSGAIPCREITGSLIVVRESLPFTANGQGEWRVVPTSWQPR